MTRMTPATSVRAGHAARLTQRRVFACRDAVSRLMKAPDAVPLLLLNWI
jgi:hypothetical protein